MDGWMVGWMDDGCGGGWMDGWMDAWMGMDGLMDGCMDGLMDGCMDGCMNGWTGMLCNWSTKYLGNRATLCLELFLTLLLVSGTEGCFKIIRMCKNPCCLRWHGLPNPPDESGGLPYHPSGCGNTQAVALRPNRLH